MKTGSDATGFTEHGLKGCGVGRGRKPGEPRCGEIPKNSFLYTDTGDKHGAQAGPARERGKDNGGDAEDFRAIAANAKFFHAFFDVQFQNAPQTVAQQTEIRRGHSIDSGTRHDSRESFGVAARSGDDGVRKIRRIRPEAAQKGKDAVFDALELLLA